MNHRSTIMLLLAVAVAVCAASASAAEPGTYLGRRIAWTMTADGAHWLLRPEREKEESTAEMIRELRLAPGMTVADVGCGNGYHTLMLADEVGPAGRVYAVDIQQRMLSGMEARAVKAGARNIVPVLGTLQSPRLPEGTIDLALLVDAYHEFSHPEQMLRQLKASLAPGGVLALVEFRAEDPEVPIKPDHRMSRAQIDKEMRANGFELVRAYDGLPWQHLVLYGVAAESVAE